MMQTRRRIYHFFISVLVFFSTSTVTFAQPGDPGGDPDVPISGIGILIALGGLLGISRFFKKDNQKDS